MKIRAREASTELAVLLKRLGGKLQSGFVLPPPAVAVTEDLPEGGIVELFHDSGLLVLDGVPAFAYIRDHTVVSFFKGDVRNKVHFAVCSKLKQMQRENRFKSRYRKTSESTGVFKIDVAKSGGAHKEKLERLDPCQCCLDWLGYKDFDFNLSKEARHKIVKGFDFGEAYAMLRKKYQNHLAGNENGWPFEDLEQSGASTGYTDNWREISYNIRKHFQFKCQRCGIAGRHLTDVHHIDGHKANLDIDNLRCLCKLCHAEHHTHYKVNKSVRSEILRLRRDKSGSR